MPGTIEVVRPAAPGEGVVRADEDARAGEQIVPVGRVLRPQDLGMLAAAGVTSVTVYGRPVVTIFSTGDEVVPPETRSSARPGTRRDGGRARRPGHGRGRRAGLRRDRGRRLGRAGEGPPRRAAGQRRAAISAGSSVGVRDETANAVGRLGEPGIWCHGLAIKPGKPTLLAECAGVPVIGLPGNPRSALVVFRLIGMPVVRLVGGWAPCRRPSRRSGPGCRAISRPRPGASTSSR